MDTVCVYKLLLLLSLLELRAVVAVTLATTSCRARLLGPLAVGVHEIPVAADRLAHGLPVASPPALLSVGVVGDVHLGVSLTQPCGTAHADREAMAIHQQSVHLPGTVHTLTRADLHAVDIQRAGNGASSLSLTAVLEELTTSVVVSKGLDGARNVTMVTGVRGGGGGCMLTSGTNIHVVREMTVHDVDTLGAQCREALFINREELTGTDLHTLHASGVAVATTQARLPIGAVGVEGTLLFSVFVPAAEVDGLTGIQHLDEFHDGAHLVITVLGAALLVLGNKHWQSGPTPHQDHAGVGAVRVETHADLVVGGLVDHLTGLDDLEELQDGIVLDLGAHNLALGVKAEHVGVEHVPDHDLAAHAAVFVAGSVHVCTPAHAKRMGIK
jgi:hypothetical protein